MCEWPKVLNRTEVEGPSGKVGIFSGLRGRDFNAKTPRHEGAREEGANRREILWGNFLIVDNVDIVNRTWMAATR
jgi:hypothetical protein